MVVLFDNLYEYKSLLLFFFSSLNYETKTEEGEIIITGIKNFKKKFRIYNFKKYVISYHTIKFCTLSIELVYKLMYPQTYLGANGNEELLQISNEHVNTSK